MTPIRIAVIGVGHLGKIHTRLLAGDEQFELVGVVDPSTDARQEMAREHGVAVFSDFRQLDGKAEAAIVATPTILHHEVASHLLKHGVHLLVEKPITTTVTQANALIQLASDHGRILQVGHVERFNPAYRVARQLIQQPRYIESARLAPYTFRSTDVGVVLDLMIHDIDLALATVDSQVVDVLAMGAAVIGPHEDIAQARLTFANGCVANLSASRVNPEACRTMQIFAASGHTSLDLATGTARHVAISEAVRQQAIDPANTSLEKQQELRETFFKDLLPSIELPVPEGNAIRDEHADLAMAIRTGKEVQVPGTAGRDALAVAHRVVQALSNHRWNGRQPGPRGPHFWTQQSGQQPTERPNRQAG